MQVTTVGLDLAKNIFQVHGITEDGSVRSTSRSGGRNSCNFSRSLSLVSSGWRRVDQVTIGRGSFKSLAMKSG